MDPSALESELQRLSAANLDEELLDRLDSCIAGDWTQCSPAEIALEHQLRAVAPTPLSAGLLASLESLAAGTPFPRQEEKIVHFPEKVASPPRHPRRWWAAAAAVAACGALTAWMLPHPQTNTPVAGGDVPPSRKAVAGTQGELVPASFDRGLSEATDEGVIWQSNNQPKRVLKVVYTDKATYKDPATGRTYQVEKPRVEYIIVPAKAD